MSDLQKEMRSQDRSVQRQNYWTGTPEGLAIETTLTIADKHARDVDFKLNIAQYSLDTKIQMVKQRGWPVRIWVPKARQEGVSSYILGRFTIKALAYRNRNIRIVAHTTIATQRMLAKVKYFLKHLKGPQPDLHYNTKNELTFPDTDSSISIYTAGSPEAARSDMITDLHNSEVAFWPDPKPMTAALFQTVPTDGEIFSESTGNGAMTWYHRNCLRAASMEYDSQLHFLPWHEFPEYVVPYDYETHGKIEPLLEFEEPELLMKWPGLTVEQILWRRTKIRQMDMDIPLFKQEYPMTLDECFMFSNTSFFHKVHYIKTPEWISVDKNLSILEGHPREHHHYTLGVDVGAGVGQDRSTIQVICYETSEQVAEYKNDMIAPDALALEIEYLGKRFGWTYRDRKNSQVELFSYAYLVVESNNFGIATLMALDQRRIYPRNMIYSDGRASSVTGTGFLTTKKNKPVSFSMLRRDMALQEITIYSEDLVEEVSAFTKDLKAMEGSYDDLIMAFCMAYIGLAELPHVIASQAPTVRSYGHPTPDSPFQVDWEEESVYEAQPLKPQHDIAGYYA